MEENALTYPKRVGIQQRLLPAYRAPFFDALAPACPAGVSVIAGQPMRGETMGPVGELKHARFAPAKNRYWLGGPLVLVWQDGLLEWLKAWQPEALILEANQRNRSNPLAVRWMHARGLPVIGWGLGAPAPTGLLAGWQRTGWKRTLAQFDALITYSRQGAGEYAQMGFPPERIFIAPNAVTPRPVSPPPQRPESLDDSPVVLFVGRLQPRKRVDLLLEAVHALPGEVQPDVWIVGDGPARAELEARAQKIYPRARFFGDQRGTDLDILYEGADLFVLPGTGGLAVQQAMGSGLPVVVAEADGTQVDLVRSENGWCVPPGDLDRLAQTLQDALSDIPRLRQMGAASYRIVADEINLEAMVSVFLRALNSVG